MHNVETCLVTGCAGFVGSHLVEHLLDMGQVVVGVDIFSTGKPENMATFRGHPRFHFHKLDINTADLLPHLKQDYPGLNRIFHLAAIVSAPFSVDNPELTMKTNFISSINMYEQSVDLGFLAYVFAGSAAEYGNLEQLPLKEEAVSIKEEQSGLANLQESPYGISKYLVSNYIDRQGFGCSLRFFNIYGPRQDPNSPYSGVISRFVDQALRNSPITIQGDGTQSRDFIYVQDVVKTYLLAAGLAKGEREKAEPLRGAFNVGSQVSLSILELADKISAISGSTAGKVFVPPRAGDIKHSLANVSKLRHATGFRPEVPLEQGLRRVIDWTRSEQQVLEKTS